MSEQESFELQLWRAVEGHLGDGTAKPPTEPPPALPSAGQRPPGLLTGFRYGETEVGLLFYRGATRSNIWIQSGHGNGESVAIGDKRRGGHFPMTIVMSCGTTVTWETEQRVPPNAMDCGCGSAHHRLVMYLDAEAPPSLAKPAPKEGTP